MFGRRAPRPTPRGGGSWRGTFVSILILIVFGLAVGFILDQPRGLFVHLPPSWRNAVHAALVLLVGLGVSRLLERRLFRMAAGRLRPDYAASLRFLVRLVLYTAIILSFLAAVGVGLPSLVFGGAFATVIVGLAGQQVFANIIGGIWIILFHPFRVGERIGLVTWQYPLLMPSYPHEAMRPTYHGIVRDINLMYTVLENSDGFTQLIPNGIIVQAFIENRSDVDWQHLRIRFDMPPNIEPAAFIEALESALRDRFLESGDVRGIGVLVADIAPAAFSLLVTLDTRRQGELLRSDVLMVAGRLIAARQTGAGGA